VEAPVQESITAEETADKVSPALPALHERACQAMFCHQQDQHRLCCIVFQLLCISHGLDRQWHFTYQGRALT
jgi:hypothetical protein